ncbi:hypothetical protein [Streptomyces sp. NPDC058579]|uniref:hypothetical protein n=1 Tax=Streptomyces sp. NPDC058579 TaxID=3346548 RepID=UPI003665FB51
MLRHAISPSCRFSQISHEILRHPELNSDAVRLLCWQLSLPDGVNEPLSKTAERAGIRKVGFHRAKGQLKLAGYLHEWREQGTGGRWATRQLVSNVPLSPGEAAALRSGTPVNTSPAPPTDTRPAAGEPTRRAVGRHPDLTPVGNTSNPPPPEVPGVPEDPEDPAVPEARRIVDSLPALDPRLRVPRAMLPELAGLAARWLEAGHLAEAVRDSIARCLPGRGSPIHRPGGLLRYILREVPPVPPPPAPPRVAGLRECESGLHVQPYLFRPLADEEHCGGCRQPSPASAQPTTVGPDLVRAALRGHPSDLW